MSEVRRHDFDDVTLMDQPAHGACTMIRRKCLEEIGGYDESLGCQDGYDLWIRFIEHYKVKNLNVPLFYYRQHHASLTRDEQNLLDTRGAILERHARRLGRKLAVTAIIPIRGKPTDPSSPALKALGGRALVDWTIAAALGADTIDNVVVTTPDDDILNHVASTWPDTVTRVRRNAGLAAANSFLAETLLHALSTIDTPAADCTAIMTLAIEYPFRTSRQLNAAVDVMELFKTDAVIGVRPETDHFYQHKGAGLEPVRQNIHLRLEREELLVVHAEARAEAEEERQERQEDWAQRRHEPDADAPAEEGAAADEAGAPVHAAAAQGGYHGLAGRPFLRCGHRG